MGGVSSKRAAGVAWMLGVGRFGGTAGSFLIAELTRRQLDFASIFSIVAVAGVIAAVALAIKQIASPEGIDAHATGDRHAPAHGR